jgi:hypothetical protein
MGGVMSARAKRWIAWGAFVTALVLWLNSGVLGWLTRSAHTDNGWGESSFAVEIAFGLILATFPLVGLLIALRRPETPIGWLLLAIGIFWGIAGMTSYADYGIVVHPGSLPGAALVASIAGHMWAPPIGLMGTFLLLVFPDGRLPGPRWRWVAYLSAFAIAGTSVVLLVTPGTMGDNGYPDTINPLGIEALHGVIGSAQIIMLLLPVMMVASAAGLVVRFRRSHGVERQQIKWLAAAAAAVAATYLVAMAASLLTPASVSGSEWVTASQNLALLSFGLIPVAIGIAVLRYRLYEIDVIIRKTLVYAVLIGALALVYLGGISLIGWALRDVAGQSSALAVTLSTLAVAAAFQPLRHRIQLTVDRRFFRQTYDAQRTLDAFNGRLREQVDLDSLQNEVLGVARQTLQPGNATLWLRPPTKLD